MPSEQVVSHITAAEAELEREYQRTKAEAEAFQSFRQKVRDITPQQPRSDHGTTTQPLLAVHPPTQQSSGCEQVRRAYQDTILSVAHYAEKYAEPLSENMAAEFGEELATGISTNSKFTTALKEGIETASRQAACQRTRLLSHLEIELTELATSRSTIKDLECCLNRGVVEQFQGHTFTELRSEYESLRAAKTHCDDLAKARQESILRHRRTETSVHNIELQTYLCADLDVTYPILADLAELGSSIQRKRKKVEQAIADL